MRKFIYVLLILTLALPNLFALAQADAVVSRLEEYGNNLPQGYGVIQVDQLNAMLVEGEVTLLDVRQPEEYEAGHLEGSFNVPIRELGQNLALLPDLDATIVVICKGGARAALAGASLQILGYSDVKILAGGYDAWVGAEMPTTTEAYAVEAGTAPEIDADLYAAVDAYLSGLPEGYGLVSSQNLAAELVDNPPLLIDVRSDDEWNTVGYIDGAQHIWINNFISSQSEWPADKDAPIVVYCSGGYRGGIAAVMLNLMGYTNVRNLSGGLNAWLASGMPVVGAAVTEAPELDLVTVISDYVAAMPETFNAVRTADLKTEIDGGAELLIVDVRTADEYAEGFIEGAINIPLNELTQNLALLPDKEQNIVVVCGSGHRSAIATTVLNLLGYSNARSMLSGMGSWTAAEYPVTTDVPEYAAGTAPEVDSALLAALDSYVSAIPAGYYTVRAADLGVELIENPPILIDVRTDGEWDGGHIEGATQIPLRDFMTRQSEWPADMAASIVLYDNPTHRSSMAMTFMRLLGYENVRVLGGGVGAWTKAELPLVTE